MSFLSGTLQFSEGAVPARDTAGYLRRYRATDAGRRTTLKYAKSPKGRASAHRANKVQDDKKYLTRQFLAWDGEGVTVDGKHLYVLLANSVGDHLVRRDGLTSVDCFELLLSTKARFPDAIHVVYGGGYDFNFFLRSLDKADVRRVYDGDRRKGVEVRLGERTYWVSWRRGRSFRVSDGKRTVTVYDVLPFFQRSFVKACDEYLGKDWDSREMIMAQKLMRSAFTLDELDDIGTYNDAELRNLVALMNELRKRLDLVGLRPGRWDGPGAVAAALLSDRGIKHAKSDPASTPEGAAYATRCAYAGGRFELIRFGSVHNAPVYEYDINSAYPYALQHVPCLAHGRWILHDGDPGTRKFALYHVRYRGPQDEKPAPLFRRDERGAISYPGTVDGWYWTPEVDAARDYCNIVGPRGGKGVRGSLEILECWEWENNPEACTEAGHSPTPFEWIGGYYLKRQALKKAGDGAHVGIKLALNSLYGKLAQQVGWYVNAAGELVIPPFHELAWAGYTTSTCRAMVLRAAMLDLDAIVAFETDALFSSRPLPVDIGTGLGQWEVTEFSSLAYCQSGTYFGTVDGKEVNRTRGVDLGTVTREHYETALRQGRAEDQRMAASLTRFVGAGLALATDWELWCTWHKTPKSISAGPPEGSKRDHQGCPHCYTDKEYRAGKRGIRPDVWHTTVCPTYDNGFHYSHAYPVEWEDPGVMPELAELRNSNYEEWDGNE